MYFLGSVCVFLRVTLLKVIVLSRFLVYDKIFNDVIQTVGLPITSFTVSGDIKKKVLKKLKKKKKPSENDQLTGHFQSFFIYFFSSPQP